MLLDKRISYQTKVIISVICGGLWIYFRTADCYDMIPRTHVLPVIFVCAWIYANYLDPLFLPLGLSMLILYRVATPSPPPRSPLANSDVPIQIHTGAGPP